MMIRSGTGKELMEVDQCKESVSRRILIHSKFPYQPSAGSGWQEVDGRLVWISSGSYGEVWGVNKDGQIFQRGGITRANPVGSGWKHVPGELIRVSVWAGQAWGVNKDHTIFSTLFLLGMPNE